MDFSATVAPPVKIGDRVAIVAPASPVSLDFLEAGVAILESWGLVPVVHQQVWSKQGYLSGSDEERAEALVEVFDNPALAAVICAKGGYGCTRLLDILPPHKLGPRNLLLKRFFGFSDITALHSLMRMVVPKYVSFHAPMPATDFFVKGTKLSKESLHRALFAPTLEAACPPMKMGKAKKTAGIVRGRLIGGNMTVFTSLLGTSWQENLSGCVLLLEDMIEMYFRGITGTASALITGGWHILRAVNEVAYHVDRMFTHLRSASGDQLDKLEALVLGDFDGALQDVLKNEKFDKIEKEDVEKKFWLEQLQLPPNLPVLSGLPIGHIMDNRVLPLGALVDVNMKKCELSVGAPMGEDPTKGRAVCSHALVHIE